MRLLLFLILSFLFASTTHAQQGNSTDLVEEGLKRFDNKSGKILYEIIGDAVGQMEYTFDHWGWLEFTSRKMEYTLFGMQSSEDRVEFRDGDFFYNIDLKTSKGKKSKNKDTSDLLRYKSGRETIEALYTKMGGTTAGTDQILGKTVNIWKFESGNTLELWEWNGIVLKGKRKLSKVVYEYEAKSIELDPEVNIRLPDGITWVD